MLPLDFARGIRLWRMVDPGRIAPTFNLKIECRESAIFLWKIGKLPPQQCPDASGGPMVDPGRIELPPQQCECRVIPLYYGPLTYETKERMISQVDKQFWILFFS